MHTKIIDLTHILNENISVYPDTLGPKFEKSFTVEKDGFAEIKATMVLHSGTHIDAPCHILKNTKSLDQYPLEKFMGKAIVISCLDVKEITLEFLKSYEDKIHLVNFVLFYTGWQFKWATPSYVESCPILTEEAAKWLTNFSLDGIGLDAFSVDKTISAATVTEKTLPNHFILLGKEILLIENLTNLDKLPHGIFEFQCLPLNVEGADGSPVRAIAITKAE